MGARGLPGIAGHFAALRIASCAARQEFRSAQRVVSAQRVRLHALLGDLVKEVESRKLIYGSANHRFKRGSCESDGQEHKSSEARPQHED